MRFNADGSDVDLILVVKTGTPFTKRPADFSDLYDLGPTLDLLVYTPDEFARLTRDPSPGFWKSVTESMVRFL